MRDDEILNGLKEGRPAIFRQLFDIYYDELVLFANHLLNDPQAAEDVVQDCLVDFWVNKRFQILTGGLNKYLFQSVKHAALNYLRGSRRREQRHKQATRDGLFSNDRTEMEEEEIEILYAAIHQLPEERKKIFMMVCLEGKKYQEVADILNISINTVKTQMGRAFQYLRSKLKGREFSLFLLMLLEK